MIFGSKQDKPVTHPNYLCWGIVDSIQTKQQSNTIITKVQNKLQQLSIDLTGFHSVSTKNIDYYRGENLPVIKAILVRFQKITQPRLNLNGEHLSVIYDPQQDLVLGITKMETQPDNNAYVSHQEALNKAIEFLKQAAPDLITPDVSVPTVIKLDPQDRMAFTPPLILNDQLRMDWINHHEETILLNDALHTVSGMKVKMYLLRRDLWMWVIIDSKGQVQTFEREVSWNMAKAQRNTQMWLHDKWLKAHNIDLG